MMVHCDTNYDLGNCPYKRFCFASMNDRTITGCNLPFVWAGMLPREAATVEHTVKRGEECGE